MIPIPWALVPLGWESSLPDLWDRVDADELVVLVPYAWMFPLGSTLDRCSP